MKHLLKHGIAILTSPLVIALLVAALACLCRWRGQRRVARWLWAVSIATAYLSCLLPVGNALLAPLELQYPPLRNDASLADVRDIVVLGGGYAPRNGVPVTAALEEDTLARIVEGVVLAKRFSTARLIVSGGTAGDGVPSALGYAIAARELGIDNQRLLVSDKSLDTAQEAGAMAKLLGDERFILVTSAYHMVRAMRLMERAGAHPIPAPTGQCADEPASGLWSKLLPTSSGLRRTERAMHEYVALTALAFGLQ